MSVKGVDTFWYENGNTGYMNLQLNISFTDGKVYRNTFRTGLCSSMSYEDTPLTYLENILVGELTENSRITFDTLVKEDYWKEVVVKHDTQLIERKRIFISNLEYDLNRLIKGVV